MISSENNHRLRRFLSIAFVVLLSVPAPPLMAQGGATSSGPASGAGRIGGSSFGTGTLPTAPTIGPSEPSLDARVPYFQTAPMGGPVYQIHVLGEVNQPATYRMAASTRLSEAIQRAGNILERGSERRVQLRRKGEKTKVIDLLAFKQFGSLENNPYLLDNDVVFIPLKKMVVRIAGAVKRPDTYELRSEKTLSDLIKLAGGYTPGAADDEPIKVIRHNDGQTKKVLDIDNDKETLKEFYLKNADVVVVAHFLTKGKEFDYNLPRLPGDSAIFYPSYEERVFIIGAVRQPGPYPFSPYYHVREYLTLSGGLTKDAKSERKIKVMSSKGEVSKAKMDTVINPGDTIIIPERYMRAENWATLILGISGAALGITTTILTLTR